MAQGLERARIDAGGVRIAEDERRELGERAPIGDLRAQTLQGPREVDDVALAPDVLVGGPEQGRVTWAEETVDASGEVGLDRVVVDERIVDVDQEGDLGQRWLVQKSSCRNASAKAALATVQSPTPIRT